MNTTPIDLTPFDFTPTENLVYSRLLTGGPSSGYAVARDLTIARANIYQALRGLVAKGAAQLAGERPQKFRAVRPTDLYAALVERSSQKLDRLEQQLHEEMGTGASAFVPLSSERTFVEMAARLATRDGAPLFCVAPPRVITGLGPALRKRVTDGLPLALWILGDGGAAPVPVAGVADLPRAIALFGGEVAVVATASAAGLARLGDRTTAGYWTTDPAVVGATRGACSALTGEAP